MTTECYEIYCVKLIVDIICILILWISESTINMLKRFDDTDVDSNENNRSDYDFTTKVIDLASAKVFKNFIEMNEMVCIFLLLISY